MKTIIAFVALVGLCYGQMTSTGTCSTPKSVYFIDRPRLNNYTEYWGHYELPAPTNRINDCTLLAIPDVPIEVSPWPELPMFFGQYSSVINATTERGDFIFAPTYDCKSQSVYNVTFNLTDFLILERPLYIIGTDYENWLVVYMCNQLATMKQEFLYILGTAFNTTMPAQAVTDARAAINAAGLSDSALVSRNFPTDCAPALPSNE